MTTELMTEAGLEINPKDFNTAIHNAVITVHNPITDNHRTFSIKTVKRDTAWSKKGDRLAYLLTGPDRDNHDNWKAFAFVGPTGILNVFHKLRGKNGERSVWEKYARILAAPTRYPSLRFLMMGYCRRCNRPLTRPDSIRDGMGEICREKGMNF